MFSLLLKDLISDFYFVETTFFDKQIAITYSNFNNCAGGFPIDIC